MIWSPGLAVAWEADLVMVTAAGDAAWVMTWTTLESAVEAPEDPWKVALAWLSMEVPGGTPLPDASAGDTDANIRQTMLRMNLFTCQLQGCG